MPSKQMNAEEKLLEGMKQAVTANEILEKRNEMLTSLGVQAALTGLAVTLSGKILPLSPAARELYTAYSETLVELLRLTDLMVEQKVGFK